jgi:hypothetical protein
MHIASDKFAPLRAQAVSKWFLAREIAYAYFTRGQALKIFFSDREGWVQQLARKFRFTRHEVTFGDIRHADLSRYDIVVPLAMEDLRFLSDLPPGTNKLIPVPARRVVDLCDDKLEFSRYLGSRGFDQWLPCVEARPAFPYVLKRNPDEAGEHCHIVTGPEAERALPPECKGPEYFKQEFVAGRHEYASHILFVGERVVYALTIAYGYDTDYPIKGRSVPLYMMLCGCPWLPLFASMLTALDFQGLCCVNYKMRNGKPVVLEINPRLGRSATGYFFAFLRHLEPQAARR